MNVLLRRGECRRVTTVVSVSWVGWGGELASGALPRHGHLGVPLLIFSCFPSTSFAPSSYNSSSGLSFHGTLSVWLSAACRVRSDLKHHPYRPPPPFVYVDTRWQAHVVSLKAFLLDEYAAYFSPNNKRSDANEAIKTYVWNDFSWLNFCLDRDYCGM